MTSRILKIYDFLMKYLKAFILDLLWKMKIFPVGLNLFSIKLYLV
jgi:hypothetical protein